MRLLTVQARNDLDWYVVMLHSLKLLFCVT